LATTLSPDQISAHRPFAWHNGTRSPLAHAQERMVATGQWHGRQAMGRRWPIGCVALEITQRCNLDCTLCYLSENAEAVRDIPLSDLFRRIDAIARLYGPGTDVQVTGGDPTLRQGDELIQIVARIREKGMQPSLFTNGIRLKRDLLEDLVEAGLVDVAFHVDMTQQRKGYGSEAELNQVRLDYIERARGLPLSVFFNTTVFDGNVDQIPEVVAFFVRHSDVVRMASFQLQADTGRGSQGRRSREISIESLQGRIEAGAKAKITFDAVQAGHAGCNRYGMSLVANGRVHDLFDNKVFIERLLSASAGLTFDRTNPRAVIAGLLGWFVRHPGLWPAGAGWGLGKLRRMAWDLAAARGRVNKLSFFIHDFMDASCLDKDRIEACVFMVATADGPLSMCLHNAKRDEVLFRPIRLPGPAGERFWHPVTGRTHRDEPSVTPAAPSPKGLKGRAKTRGSQASSSLSSQ
jgi:molybdenum cofactor biosynthesis enzyme MoaA